MSVQLEDHAEWIDQLDPGSRTRLEIHWSDATKVFSARGLDNFVKGAAALRPWHPTLAGVMQRCDEGWARTRRPHDAPHTVARRPCARAA